MYTKTEWVDRVTPLSSTNFNKMEQGIYKNALLHNDSIQGTTQTPTYIGGKITQVVHRDSGNNVVRTDTYTYTQTLITEARTLATGEILTLKHYFNSDGTFNRTEAS